MRCLFAVVVLTACRLHFAASPGTGADGSGNANGSGGEGAGLGDGGTPQLGDALARGANLAFVSSVEYTPGALGGTAGADAACNQLASAAGLPGTYVAWLSSSTQNAIDRLAAARGWVRVDGLPIADQPGSLGSRLWYTVGLDEYGARPNFNYAVTATDVTGQLSGATCGDFTVADTSSVINGFADAADDTFTNAGTIACNATNAHLYCFGIDHNTPLSLVPVTGRAAFVTASVWTPGTGFSAADAACQSEASNQGLPGTYLALLASKTASTASRFSLTGSPWVRVDGVRLAATPSALMAGKLDAPIDLIPSGAALASTFAWTGYMLPTDVGTAIGSETCNDWNLASGGAFGGRGSTSRASPDVFTHQASAACNTGAHLFCLQQ